MAATQRQQMALFGDGSDLPLFTGLDAPSEYIDYREPWMVAADEREAERFEVLSGRETDGGSGYFVVSANLPEGAHWATGAVWFQTSYQADICRDALNAGDPREIAERRAVHAK